MLKKVVEELLSIKGITKEQLCRKLKMSMYDFKKYEKKEFKTMPVIKVTYMAWYLEVPFAFIERIYQYNKFTNKVN